MNESKKGLLDDGGKAKLRRILDEPVFGFAPWIVLSVVEGPDRLVVAGILACGSAILLAVLGAIADSTPKLLDYTGIVFFGLLTLVAAFSSVEVRGWLGVWAGEVSNVTISLITIGSIAVGRPFTLEYARETTDPEYWASPLFMQINYVISAVWAAVFAVTAIVGYVGDGPLHQPDNIWTNWLIQIALVILAIKFTEWYPEYAKARQEAHPNNPHRRDLRELLRPLAAYLMPAGIVALIFGGNAWWIGAGLIVLSVVITRQLRDTGEQSTR